MLWVASIIKFNLNFKLSSVETTSFTCTEPNVATTYMRSSTYESIRIGRFVFGWTVPFYLTGLVG